MEPLKHRWETAWRAPAVEPPVTPVVPPGHHHQSHGQVCAIRLDGLRKGRLGIEKARGKRWVSKKKKKKKKKENHTWRPQHLEPKKTN